MKLLFRSTCKRALLISVGIALCASSHAESENVDNALKGRDINAIMKLLQADADDQTTAVTAPIAEPVAEVKPADSVIVDEPAPATPIDPRQLSSDELDAFRSHLAKEMAAARAAQDAKAETIKQQAVQAAMPAPTPAEKPAPLATEPEAVVASVPEEAAPSTEVVPTATTPEPEATEPVLVDDIVYPLVNVSTPVQESAPEASVSVPEPRRRSWLGRLFGGSEQPQPPATTSTSEANPTTPGNTQARPLLSAPSPSSPPPSAPPANRPGPSAGPRGDVSADAMKKNREALEGLIASSREDVVRMAMGQTGGAQQQQEATPEVDADAWKAAGPGAWRYNGEWQNGTMHGQGRMIYADGWEYVGSWKNGTMDGQGTLVMPDTTKYEGQWLNGRMHGLGRLTYPDGWQFIGQWKDGAIHGQGTLVHPGK